MGVPRSLRSAATFAEARTPPTPVGMTGRSVEEGGKGRKILLGACEELAGFVLKRAAGIELEISLGVGDDRERIVLALMDSGEEKVNVGEGRIAGDRLQRALEGI